MICGGVLLSLSLDIILFLPLYHAHLLAPSPLLSSPSFSPRLQATAYLSCGVRARARAGERERIRTIGAADRPSTCTLHSFLRSSGFVCRCSGQDRHRVTYDSATIVREAVIYVPLLDGGIPLTHSYAIIYLAELLDVCMSVCPSVLRTRTRSQSVECWCWYLCICILYLCGSLLR